MAESISPKEDDDDDGETSLCAREPETTALTNSASASRKVKRKVAKKEKRKQIRKELAEKARAEEEARLNDPEEQRRIQLEEERENERLERERREFEEREKLFLEELARKKAEEEEEEESRKALEEELKKNQASKDNELNDDDEWEYVEEGPPEIIWQGNEIIVKKNRVKVKKKDATQQIEIEDPNRPTSNPLPPQSEAYTAYKDASKLSAQQLLENVAQQVPNFGTEQDKAHCPFHIKTGACRFGLRCSRVHFYPDKSCTLLIKNMYTGPGLAWEQDEGLESYSQAPQWRFTVLFGLCYVGGKRALADHEEVERCYEEFYEDVHTEFLKFGEIVNFKVCRNGSFHLRGNVFIHYKSLDSAVQAYHAVNGRYFAGKQVTCEFVSVTKWKVAICGEYMKSRLKTCSRGTACNFLHCFGNPGGDYEWADWDRPPPRYWVKKMTALFGYSDESWYDRDQQMEQESPRERRNSSRIGDRDRYYSRRSRSRERDTNGSYARSPYEEHDVRKGSYQKQHTHDGRKRLKSLDEKYHEETKYGDHQHDKNLSSESDCDRSRPGRDTDRNEPHNGKRRMSRHEHEKAQSRDYFVASRSRSRSRAHASDSGEDLSDMEIGRHHNGSRKRSSHTKEVPALSDDYGESGHLKLEDGRVRNRSQSGRRGHSSLEASKVSSSEELIKSSGHQESRNSGRSRSRTKATDIESRNMYDEVVEEVGHRESDNELLPNKHKRSKRKLTSDGTVESESTHRYSKRHKYHDIEHNYPSEDNAEEERWKPDESSLEKDQHKSRRLLDDDHELHGQTSGRRSRRTRWSSRERRSSDSLEGVDSAEDLQESKEKHKKRCREKHRSHGRSSKGEEKEKSRAEKKQT